MKNGGQGETARLGGKNGLAREKKRVGQPLPVSFCVCLQWAAPRGAPSSQHHVDYKKGMANPYLCLSICVFKWLHHRGLHLDNNYLDNVYLDNITWTLRKLCFLVPALAVGEFARALEEFCCCTASSARVCS